jgi:bifunctional non-homologous end joining protein LigD
MLPFAPMPLGKRVSAFDGPEWLFELKYDGFRALACFDSGRCTLVSRNGNIFKSFPDLCEDMGRGLAVRDAVLDGEIVCLDRRGRPQFYDLLYRRRPPVFVAFDILRRGTEDLRYLPLADRKHELRRILGRKASRMMYAEHMQVRGRDLFGRVCKLDLEGIVAKHRGGHYTADRETTTWFKIRNPDYSQWEGRVEAFERDRQAEPGPGWHTCSIAAEALATT